MPSIEEDELIFRYGIVNAMYPLSGMFFAPLFGWLETTSDGGTNEKTRRRGIVRKIGFISTSAFFLGNILYATVSYISASEDFRFYIIVLSRIIAGIASGMQSQLKAITVGFNVILKLFITSLNVFYVIF